MSGHIQLANRGDSERNRLLPRNGTEEDPEGDLQARTPINAPTQNQNTEYVVCKERWYILAIFSALAFLFLCNWNTWGPIQATASAVLQWSPGQFALLANLGPFTFLTSAFFFSWLLHAKACLYIAVVLFGLFQNSTIPLFLEVTVESAFPIGEETTTTLMTWMNNITSLGFLILPMTPSIVDFSWLNWVMLGSVVICIPLMVFYKEHYNRINFDASHPVDDSNTPENCNGECSVK